MKCTVLACNRSREAVYVATYWHGGTFLCCEECKAKFGPETGISFEPICLFCGELNCECK